MSRLVLGLTGSIGMGKSTTAGMFRDQGVPVWDADAAVHRLYGPGAPGAEAISRIVPAAVTPEGVDRSVLKAAIAETPDLLQAIEAAIHPLVAADRQAFLDRHADAGIVMLDIPLLFETGGEDMVDRVIVVSTDPSEQRRRVLSRPGMDDATFERLLARQVPDAIKRARADHVIPTDTLETARAAVKELLTSLRRETQGNA
jgi:dephospho-CoA kinase